MIPIIKPLIDEREADAARRVILSGWVTQGPEVRAFEEEFAAYTGARSACAVSNCTTALHLALLAAGVGPGDEVITVSHSFIATANAIRYCGAIPVFCDIEPGTFNMDFRQIEPAISGKTKAILCVHQMGMPCNLAEITKIGAKHGIPVVEDAACAIGSEILWKGSWQKIGRPHGESACFSFHPRKIATTGDGGMVVSANPSVTSRCKLWRQHSMSVPDTARHGSQSVIFEEYTELGFNYRMTDIQAAVGRVQITRLGEVVGRRRELAENYRNLLSGISGIVQPDEPEWARANWQSFCVRLPEGSNQKMVMQKMLDQGVSTRRGIMNSHLEPAYRKEPWRCWAGCTMGDAGRCTHLNESVSAHENSIILPLFHNMTSEEQNSVVDALSGAVKS